MPPSLTAPHELLTTHCDLLTIPEQRKLLRHLLMRELERYEAASQHRTQQGAAAKQARLAHATRRGWTLRTSKHGIVALSTDPHDIRHGSPVALFKLVDRDSCEDSHQKRRWTWLPWRHPAVWCRDDEILPAVLQDGGPDPRADKRIHYVGAAGSLCGLPLQRSWTVAGVRAEPMRDRTVCPECAAASGKGPVPGEPTHV